MSLTTGVVTVAIQKAILRWQDDVEVSILNDEHTILKTYGQWMVVIWLVRWITNATCNDYVCVSFTAQATISLCFLDSLCSTLWITLLSGTTTIFMRHFSCKLSIDNIIKWHYIIRTHSIMVMIAVCRLLSSVVACTAPSNSRINQSLYYIPTVWTPFWSTYLAPGKWPLASQAVFRCATGCNDAAIDLVNQTVAADGTWHLIHLFVVTFIVIVA